MNQTIIFCFEQFLTITCHNLERETMSLKNIVISEFTAVRDYLQIFTSQMNQEDLEYEGNNDPEAGKPLWHLGNIAYRERLLVRNYSTSLQTEHALDDFFSPRQKNEVFFRYPEKKSVELYVLQTRQHTLEVTKVLDGQLSTAQKDVYLDLFQTIINHEYHQITFIRNAYLKLGKIEQILGSPSPRVVLDNESETLPQYYLASWNHDHDELQLN